MSDGTYLVDCPCCKTRIEVDKKTGKVLRNWAKPVIKEGLDPMQEAFKKMKEDKSRLDSYFTNAGKSLEDKKKDLEEQFEKEKKRIKDSGDTSRPINPMDLD